MDLNKIFKKKKQSEPAETVENAKTPSFIFRTKVKKETINTIKANNVALHRLITIMPEKA